MKHRKRFTQLFIAAATTAVATTAVALTVVAAPAHAAPAPQPAAGFPQTAVVLTTSTAGPSVDTATVHCKTSSVQGDVVSEPGGWPTLAWFKQSTYWCYNGTVVTSHTTHYTGGLTTAGALAGFDYKGVVAGSEGSNCYKAAGSSRTCSGVTEYAEGGFQACPVKVGCESSYVNLQSWENYKGEYFHN